MSHAAFDPRKVIRSKIGTNHMVDGDVEICIFVVDNDGNRLYIPILLEEEEAVECPPYPYIRFDLLAIRAVPHNVGATVRKHEALIGIDIGYNNMDNIDITSFGKKIADKIVDLTRTHQSDTAGIDFSNISNQGRLLIENRCGDTVFHWVLELDASFTDAC